MSAEAWIDLREQARRHMPVLPELPHLTASARATWRGRMINEYCSARVFEGLAQQIRDAGLEDELAEECAAFADEERMHGVLCGAVLEALGGEARAPRPPLDPFPRHDDAAPLEALVRNLISVSCLSETVAVALIGAERLEMPSGPLRALLSRIYADEVGHARFGWRLIARLLPSLDGDVRRRLSAYLSQAFAHLEAHELAHLPTSHEPPPEGVELGLCSGDSARGLLYDTVREVIVPGLEAAGLSARRAWRMRPRTAFARAAASVAA